MPGGRYSLQCENPQMLKQDLKPDEDEHDATHDGGGFFVARAKGVADRHAGDGGQPRFYESVKLVDLGLRQSA